MIKLKDYLKTLNKKTIKENGKTVEVYTTKNTKLSEIVNSMNMNI